MARSMKQSGSRPGGGPASRVVKEVGVRTGPQPCQRLRQLLTSGEAPGRNITPRNCRRLTLFNHHKPTGTLACLTPPRMLGIG